MFASNIRSAVGTSLTAARAVSSVQVRSLATVQRVLSKSEKKLRKTEKKKKNIAFKNSVEAKKEKVDPVLGKPNNMFIQRLKSEIEEPNVLIHGYEFNDVDKLLYGAKQYRLEQLKQLNSTEDILQATEKEEQMKRDILFRILTLRNADNEEKQKKLRQLAVSEFQRFEGDTGSSEVQAAVMTVEIYNLMDHIKKNPQDLLHIRKVRMLTQKRQRILRYLKRDNAQKYFWTIEKLGLTDENVHMEFNMDKRYMDEFEIWPGRQMVKLNKRENEEIKKKRRLEKQAIRKALNSHAASNDGVSA